MRDDFDKALNEMGKRLGLELGLDGEGRIAVAIDDVEIAMVHLDEARAVQAYAIVGDLPDDADARFYQVLLSANHMGRMTAGAALGIDVEGELVTISRRIPSDRLDGDALEAMLEDFANLARAWRENHGALVEAARGDAPQAPAAEPAEGDWMRL